ncbi:hypothetical protein BCR33DRAFT_275378 [Rhizoclosmatium globosum]|uniref:Uncharacterized protein n=1 Tax=Rhizoclosmatium globosum TaxID=329046 RepID=A0A1Y2ACJ2_9FUNG|nr:hypothetical protein BCR33DRAFT_275378 [Rhizoclosmatium globosum]|eukprot:ORY19990.1 hypothetical protein BCR33DRAFT_275378 [Rhizoclosmatium globosum]
MTSRNSMSSRHSMSSQQSIRQSNDQLTLPKKQRSPVQKVSYTFKSEVMSPTLSIKSRISIDDREMLPTEYAIEVAAKNSRSSTAGRDADRRSIVAETPKKSQRSIQSLEHGRAGSIGPSPKGSAHSIISNHKQTVAELEKMKVLAAQMEARMQLLEEQNQKLTALVTAQSVDRYSITYGSRPPDKVALAATVAMDYKSLSITNSTPSPKTITAAPLQKQFPRGSFFQAPLLSSIAGSTELETREYKSRSNSFDGNFALCS